MNKKIVRTIQGLIFISIIIAFIYVGKMDFSVKEVVDNEKFDQEYTSVSKENVFVYANAQEVYTKLKGGNAIIFMGFPANKWSGSYANLLNETAKQSGVNEILYYDFYEDRENKNATYQSIVLKLTNFVPTTDEGVQNIYAPTLIIVKNGNILAYDNETAISTGNLSPEEYWNEYKVGLKMNKFKTMFKEYLQGTP